MNRPLAILTAAVTAVSVAKGFVPLAVFGALFVMLLAAEIAGGND